MKDLKICDLVHGNIMISHIFPETGVFENVIYSPKTEMGSFNDDASWGLYDSDRNNIFYASYRRGPNHTKVGQTDTYPESKTKHAAKDHSTYIYIGPMHPHFGHFLLASLSRFWVLHKKEELTYKFLYHGDYDMSDFCRRQPLAKLTLEAYGLSVGDFVRLSVTTIIDRVFVPAPSFEETNFGYQIHGEVCKKIGNQAEIKKKMITNRSKPVFLSKISLNSGVTQLRNENIIIEYISNRGVEIVFPENLSISEQLEVFNFSPLIISSSGSALHASLLSQNSCNLIGICRSNVVVSNQPIVDLIKKNRSIFVYADSQTHASAGTGFSSVYSFNNPVGFAEDLLRLIDKRLSFISYIYNFIGKIKCDNKATPLLNRSIWP